MSEEAQRLDYQRTYLRLSLRNRKGFSAWVVNYVEQDLIVAIANNLEAIGARPALEFAEFFRPSKKIGN